MKSHPTPSSKKTGLWKYQKDTSNRFAILFLSCFVSIGLHAVVILGFNKPAPKPRATSVVQEQIIAIEMPKLDEEEEQEVTPLDTEELQAPAIAVPSLVDVPTAVDLNNAFVQPIDYRQQVQNDLSGAKLTSIPVHIQRGPVSGSGLKNVFDLAQLDRAPEPIAQPAPQFPFQYKKDVEFAEVSVEFIVTSAGDVVDIKVINSSHHGFDESTIAGVSKWKFRPGVKSGRKVNTRIRVPVRFSITSE